MALQIILISAIQLLQQTFAQPLSTAELSPDDTFIPKYHQELLLMNELPARSKFKIAVGCDVSKSLANAPTVVVNTICFFCESGGNPRMVQLPVDQVTNGALEGFNYFQDFVWNLNGKVLHASLPNNIAKLETDPPWSQNSNAKRGNWKILFEQFLTIKFNFTYHTFLATGSDGKMGGGGSGVQLQNGTWIGVTGDLVQGRADFGIVIANTPKRIYYIDFTNSFYDVGCLTYVTALPTALYSPAALLWPFDITMWIYIGCSSIISIIFLFLAVKFMEMSGVLEAPKFGLGTQLKFFLTTLLEQEAPAVPVSHGIRGFACLWIFFSLILTTVYRSKMVTLLAFPIFAELPTTFDQLAFSDYGVGFQKIGDSAYNTLAASTDPVYKKLVGEMEIFRGAALECLEKVVSSKYACISYDFSLVYLKEKNLSVADTRKLVFAPARTYNVWLGIATEGKSIYRLNFGKWLSYTRSFHLADIWDKMDMYENVRVPKFQWWKESNQTEKASHSHDEEESVGNLTLEHLLGAFYIWFASLVISYIAFCVELGLYFYHNHKFGKTSMVTLLLKRWR